MSSIMTLILIPCFMSMLALILPCGFGFFTLMPTWSCLEHLEFLAVPIHFHPTAFALLHHPNAQSDCRPAIMDAALQISGRQMMISNDNMAGEMNHTDYLSDCKGVVYSYLSKQLSSEVANEAFRMLSACQVNKVCPLTFKEPSDVIAVCKNIAAPSPTCCSSLNTYIAETQQKILITNKQAIICATQFGSMLRGGGGMINVYELCDVDLKDFGIPAFGVQDAGCLLRSLPGVVIFDNASGVSFTCDLSDNIATLHPDPTSDMTTGQFTRLLQGQIPVRIATNPTQMNATAPKPKLHSSGLLRQTKAMLASNCFNPTLKIHVLFSNHNTMLDAQTNSANKKTNLYPAELALDTSCHHGTAAAKSKRELHKVMI